MKISTAFVFVALAILSLSDRAISQETFLVDDFSDRYSAKVFISNTTEVFSPGSIAIFDKRTKKELIKVASNELSFNLREGTLVSNIKELPYGEQSLIMFEDFNFDGLKDLALMDGQNSCYHGPSYKVYLAAATGFRLSPAFTRLAQEYCGMFSVDPKVKKISTMTKSGCCWHQTSDFIVQNNVPVAMRVVEEGMNPSGLAWDYVEKNRVRGRMVTKRYSLFNAQDLAEKVIFSFEFSNNKKMRLVADEGLLSYVFTDKDDRIELLFSDSFQFVKGDATLRFTSGRTTYIVRSNGIRVESVSGKLDMTATGGTVKGSMEQLQTATFENVSVK